MINLLVKLVLVEKRHRAYPKISVSQTVKRKIGGRNSTQTFAPRLCKRLCNFLLNWVKGLRAVFLFGTMLTHAKYSDQKKLLSKSGMIKT